MSFSFYCKIVWGTDMTVTPAVGSKMCEGCCLLQRYHSLLPAKTQSSDSEPVSRLNQIHLWQWLKRRTRLLSTILLLHVHKWKMSKCRTWHLHVKILSLLSNLEILQNHYHHCCWSFLLSTVSEHLLVGKPCPLLQFVCPARHQLVESKVWYE